MLKNTLMLLKLLGVTILISDCSKSDNMELCDSSALISMTKNICLSFEHDQLTDVYRNIIENKIVTGIVEINSLMPIDDLRIRIVDDLQLVIPEIGIGGYNPDAHEVILAIDVNFNNIDETLEENVLSILAHEIHHAKRRRSVGYGNTLLQAVVSEGLADHFSIEVSGITPPPWSVALEGDDLQNWIDEASNSWHQPYNHSDWFLGTSIDIPRWAGYSIGFELVKSYLASNQDRSASDLHNEPASSFEL